MVQAIMSDASAAKAWLMLKMDSKRARSFIRNSPYGLRLEPIQARNSRHSTNAPTSHPTQNVVMDSRVKASRQFRIRGETTAQVSQVGTNID